MPRGAERKVLKMKKYEIKKEKIEIMCRVCGLIECMVNELTDDVNRYTEDDEWSKQMKETYQLRLDTTKE